MAYDIYISPATELYHYGIKGQKWGVRRYQNEDGTYTETGKKRRRTIGEAVHEARVKHTARKDAKESARAKMFYGEGAGNRRKLIKATVAERSKDPLYKEAYEEALQKQDMSKHATRASMERHSIDTMKAVKKTVPKVITTVAGATAFYIANKDTIDRFVNDALGRIRR